MNTSKQNTTSYVGEDDNHGNSGYQRLIVLPVGLLGLLENLIIIIMLLSIHKLRRRAHVFFVLCLSFSDLLFSVTLISFGVATIVFAQRDRMICCLQFIMLHISFASSLIVTLLICIERLKSVHGNIVEVSYFNRKKYFIVTLAWVFSILYMMVLFLVVPHDQEVMMIPASKCKLNTIYKDGNEYIIFASLSALYLPFIVLVLVFYAITAFKIRQRLSRTSFVSNASHKTTIKVIAGTSTRKAHFSSENISDHPGLNKPATSYREVGESTTTETGQTRLNIHTKNAVMILEPVSTMSGHCASSYNGNNSVMSKPNQNMSISATRSRQMKKALLTVTLIVLIYVICLGPIIIELFAKCFSTVKKEISLLTNGLACLNAVMNPWLYVWRFTDLRQEMKLKCSKLR